MAVTDQLKQQVRCSSVSICDCVCVCVYVYACAHVCVCMRVHMYVCVPRCECVPECVYICFCMCAHDKERDLSTPSLHMHISTMDKLQHWVQRRLGGS